MAIDIKEFLNVEKEGLFLLMPCVLSEGYSAHSLVDPGPSLSSANERQVLVSRD